jgi:hypothetical protein
MKTTMRPLVLLLALSSAAGLTGCQPTLRPADIGKVEHPEERGWPGDYEFPKRPAQYR